MNAKYSESAEHIDVRYVAHLARLHLDDAEVEQFQGQLDDILDYIKKLQELDVEGIEPTAHAIPIENVLREDVTRPSLEHEKAMKNAPAERNREFIVPKILE
ncbi:MAG: Asp-tRNA(Asn)/Glu-tRNA(Gln) amidotransferase subunit GatC [Verrucomicrobia bacterium]|nr:Asp-tRNA(Asn)/Glu-tRNA(Gln) amidotransferase subunit GatC [Verrucomicrobiota bacterium]